MHSGIHYPPQAARLDPRDRAARNPHEPGEDGMTLSRRRFQGLALGAVALPLLSRFAWAQAYPSRPLRVVVGFAPGSGIDILARLMGQWLPERLRPPFLIDNPPPP